jgi:hypothetical protein
MRYKNRSGFPNCILKLIYLLSMLIIAQFKYSNLYADEYYNFIEMVCEPNGAIVKLKNTDQWNKPPSDEDYAFKHHLFKKNDSSIKMQSIYKHGECVFSNGREVRLKLGSGQSRPYGMCGASPESWISLWVDHKKILSKHVYIPACMVQSVTKSIIIENNIVKICQYETSGNFSSLSINTDSFSCEKNSISNDAQIDEIEYPLTGNKVPAGSRILDYGIDNPICETFAGDNWNNLIKKPEFIVKPLNKANTLSKTQVDIDNDSELEDVYSESRWGRFEYTHMFILDKNNHEINTLFNALPHSHKFTKVWDEMCVNIVSKLKSTYSESIPETWSSKDKYSVSHLKLNAINKTIRAPHIITPVIFGNKTYLEFYSDDIWGLLKLKPDKNYEEICFYHKVKENY